MAAGFYNNHTQVLANGHVQWEWRDGPGAVQLHGRELLLGGWNDMNAFAPNVSTNQILESTDGGLNWTLATAGAPWFRRHSFGYGKTSDNKVWVWGGDLFYDGNAPKDIWVYEESVPGTYNNADWTNITNDWGAVGGARILFASCIHNDELFMAGGQTDYGATPTMFTDIVKWNGTVWVVTGTLPIADFSTGCLISDGTYLYILGGGQYNGGGHTNFNTHLYRSANEGSTWTDMGVILNDMDGLMYCNAEIMNDIIWFLNGSTATTNQAGVFFFPLIDNPNNVWLVDPKIPPARHASASCKSDDGNTAFFMTGNTVNDVFKITKTAY